MKVTVFSAQPYDRRFFDLCTDHSGTESLVSFTYQSAALTQETAALADDSDGVCVFVNDVLDAEVLTILARQGVTLIVLRCAGFNNVDLDKAHALGMHVARVPAYSPEAVAEHAVALIQTLNRRIHRAFNRVREGNFQLDGLLGMTLHGKTVGIVGTGKIGLALARIMKGFGCRVLGHDPYPAEAFKDIGTLVPLETLLSESDVVSLHCPLLPATHHLIDAEALASMKPGAMLINTSRGGLIDTPAVISALKMRHLGALAIDVYEQEGGIFFNDHSDDIIEDDIFQRLMTFPNVLVTGHQGFFTQEALTEIAEVTFGNIQAFMHGHASPNALVDADGVHV
ncbi:2-hydroxyacid dehydrogenase [Larsenimonas suaedae]|uniref:2-hydroxyacid dehydrogenase n=1 Tax=Larsenimonas suaedae TaxID=1851019 RepID=A0ABU1H0A8_9GAMM|nr:2-hydroxyacid dehydrogenase [Larsenimonas suaedae]MCM2973543.1 2-hydroxyacid dehydrogenase [Larsenimonas suaedae]MDR5897087.1 2-hydroxyacid dehydrogenase [Larsenimonas suaedae]